MAACVCDGIGSFARSEIAAEMVTDGITRWFHGIEPLFPDSMDEEMLLEDLEMTIRELNELVFAFRMKKGIDIGCTMSAMLLINQNYYVFHVGDSRIYHLRDTLSQITRDEVSVVESNGKVRSLLSNFIGKSSNLWMNQFSGMVGEQELFLLGTDGLFKRLKQEEVSSAVKYMKSDAHVQKVCQQLLELVLGRGERDNVSCVLIFVASMG